MYNYFIIQSKGGVAIMVEKAVEKVIAQLERKNDCEKEKIHQSLYSSSSDIHKSN